MDQPAFLLSLTVKPDIDLDRGHFPASLPWLPSLDVRFEGPVTFFVGENGSGKSTLLEAIAEACGLPVGGGGRNELADLRAPQARSELAPLLRAGFRKKPRDGYFFRSEFHAHFATLLEERCADPDFEGDPFERYGGRSLHTRSHGESFLATFAAWMEPGMILMDEPEAALSPQRQLALLAQMARLVRAGQGQIIAATHSPILMTFPGATLLKFDEGALTTVRLEETSHYQVTRGILEAPVRYWRHLVEDEEST
jgi:predicted ATPase